MEDIVNNLPHFESIPSLLLLDNDKVEELLHSVVDNILHREVKQVTSSLSSIITQRVSTALKALILSCVSRNLDEESIQKVLQLCAIPTLSDTFINMIKARNDEIRTALVEDTASIFPYALSDVNWSARLTVASSKATNINRPTVILELRLIANDPLLDQKEYWVKLELSKAELASLIQTLEKPVEVMKQLQ